MNKGSDGVSGTVGHCCCSPWYRLVSCCHV